MSIPSLSSPSYVYASANLCDAQVKKAQVMYDPHTRESRGFGFVTMESGEEADAAITAMNGTELMGKMISVEKVRPVPVLPLTRSLLPASL